MANYIRYTIGFVVKTAYNKDNKDRITIKKAIYKRFKQCGRYNGLLTYYGLYNIDALYYTYTLKVIYKDLTLNNIFLTNKLNAKLANFSGLSLDRQSIYANLFTLGSVLYHLIMGATIITKCWRAIYNSTANVRKDIKGISTISLA
ncbi:kinase-like protein [Cenococcum geophilum]